MACCSVEREQLRQAPQEALATGLSESKGSAAPMTTVLPDEAYRDSRGNGLESAEGHPAITKAFSPDEAYRDKCANHLDINTAATKALLTDQVYKDSTVNGKYLPEPPEQANEAAAAPDAELPGEEPGGRASYYLMDKGKEDSAMAFLKEVFGLELKSLDECHQAFCEVDTDGSGWLGPSEFATMLEKMGCTDVSEKDLATLVATIDTDHDELISFNEFLEALSETSKMERGASALERKIRKLSTDMQAKMERKRMTVAQCAKREGVLQSNIISYLEEEIEEASACQQLPWWVLLLLTFTCSFVRHFRPGVMHGINQSIKYDVTNNANFGYSGIIPFESGRMGHKDMYGVNSAADFWSWMDAGLLPLLCRDAPYMSELRDNVRTHCAANEIDRHRCSEEGLGRLAVARRTQLLLRHRLIGGIRLRQERRGGQPCDGDFPYARIGRCHPSQYTGYRHPGPESFFGIQEDLSYKPHFFPTLMHIDNISSQIHRLEDDFWIGEGTQRVEVSFSTYNPAERVLTMTYINFYFSFGGRIWKMIKHCSVPIELHSVDTILFDILWQGQNLTTLFMELRQLIFVLRHSSSVYKGLKVYASVWKLVDWSSCLLGIGIVINFFMWTSLVKDARDLLYTADPTVQGSWPTADERTDFFNKMDVVSLRWHDFRIFMMFYVFIIGTRFFEAFNAQPRLSLVTKTLSKSATDLLHFGIVFMVVFVNFSVAGVVIFAGEIAGFTDIGHAAYILWRLILSDNHISGVDFDDAFEGMRGAGEWRAIIWHMGFAVLVYFLLLNMILAIVLDWYTEVRGSVGSDSETLWSQAYEIYRRWIDKRKGNFMPMHEVVLTLDPTIDDEDDDNEDPVLTIDALAEKVAGLTKSQAQEIIISAAQFVEEHERDGASLSDAGNKIEALLDTIIDLHQQVQALVMLTTVITDAQMTELKSTKKLLTQLQEKAQKGLKSAPETSVPAANLADGIWAVPAVAVEDQCLLANKESSLTWKRDLR